MMTVLRIILKWQLVIEFEYNHKFVYFESDYSNEQLIKILKFLLWTLVGSLQFTTLINCTLVLHFTVTLKLK